MKYILEIYYEGECIEQRERSEPFIVPENGDKIHITFLNSHYSEEYGNWWVVKRKRHILFAEESAIQTVMLHCEPDPEQGV